MRIRREQRRSFFLVTTIVAVAGAFLAGILAFKVVRSKKRLNADQTGSNE